MKKTLTIVMAMVLVAAVAITGTLAYMSAQADPVTNTFKFGNMEIKLDESKVGDDGKIITGEGADRVLENGYKVIPGATVDKDPTVHVKGGSEKCYVYVSVTNNIALDNGTVVASTKYIENETEKDYNDAKWTIVKTEGNTVVYRYNEAVDASALDENDFKDLELIFNKVTFSGDITKANVENDLKDGKTIVIKAYAHQSENIESVTVADKAACTNFGVTPITVID